MTRAMVNPKKVYRTIAKFPSKSKLSKEYNVKMDESGNLSCNCPIWRFKQWGVRDCPHIRIVKTEYIERNPEERKIRPLVRGMTAQDRRFIREAEETEIREWLNKIQSANSLTDRRKVISSMIKRAKDEGSVRVVGEVIKRGRLHEEIETMRLRKLLNPTKIPWERLSPRGYRKCDFCGSIVYTRRYQKQDICKECYAKKENPLSLYQAFHGSPPTAVRKVRYEPPKGQLIKIGRLSQINYIPEYPSQRRKVEYYHKSGDIGTTVLKSNAILATNKEGTQLYILKEKGTKYPKFTERGIIG